MSLSMVLAMLWALAATGVALMPYRWQFPPGILLLISAPFLLGFIAHQHGIWIFALALAGFLSMFRRPLIYLGRKYWNRITGSEEQEP